METVPILKAARKLLQQGWCQEAYARKADGLPCEAMDPLAVKWDLVGAVLRAAGGYQGCHGDDAERVVDFFVLIVGTHSVNEWNDSPATTQRRAIEAIDKLLELRPWAGKSAAVHRTAPTTTAPRVGGDTSGTTQSRGPSGNVDSGTGGTVPKRPPASAPRRGPLGHRADAEA